MDCLHAARILYLLRLLKGGIQLQATFLRTTLSANQKARGYKEAKPPPALRDTSGLQGLPRRKRSWFSRPMDQENKKASRWSRLVLAKERTPEDSDPLCGFGERARERGLPHGVGRRR